MAPGDGVIFQGGVRTPVPPLDLCMPSPSFENGVDPDHLASGRKELGQQC